MEQFIIHSTKGEYGFKLENFPFGFNQSQLTTFCEIVNEGTPYEITYVVSFLESAKNVFYKMKDYKKARLCRHCLEKLGISKKQPAYVENFPENWMRNSLVSNNEKLQGFWNIQIGGKNYQCFSDSYTAFAFREYKRDMPELSNNIGKNLERVFQTCMDSEIEPVKIFRKDINQEYKSKKYKVKLGNRRYNTEQILNTFKYLNATQLEMQEIGTMAFFYNPKKDRNDSDVAIVMSLNS